MRTITCYKLVTKDNSKFIAWLPSKNFLKPSEDNKIIKVRKRVYQNAK
jgi:hypothetical protein